MDPKEYKAKFEKRMAGLRIFQKWEAENQVYLTPDETLKCLSELYSLLPEAVRSQVSDSAGQRQMHQLLAKVPGDL